MRFLHIFRPIESCYFPAGHCRALLCRYRDKHQNYAFTLDEQLVATTIVAPDLPLIILHQGLDYPSRLSTLNQNRPHGLRSILYIITGAMANSHPYADYHGCGGYALLTG